ncbi:hypothetical protein E2C01_080640 [Portunus trituberculatus]|uniref:Uncharacterized protein n=1 Tax=Portunus trituberculatus TaxID=210409 RepID=A0A5B7IPQ7_PORTR|nr:hypothetical protein [Portunus trituberculatus]
MWKTVFSNILHTLPHLNLFLHVLLSFYLLTPAPGLPCLSFQCHLLFYILLLGFLSHFLQPFFVLGLSSGTILCGELLKLF